MICGWVGGGGGGGESLKKVVHANIRSVSF